MPRPYRLYLLAVLLPAALTAGAGAFLARGAWEELARASQHRAGVTALRALERDREGGRASSLAPLARALGLRLAIYEDGRLAAASDPPPEPGEDGGSLLVRDEGTGAATGPARAMLVGPLTAAARPAPVPLPLLLLTGLVLVFAALAGWILLAGEPPRTRGGAWMAPGLLVALPLLAAWGFLVRADALYRDAADRAERRDLARALAVARMQGVAGDPEAIHALSGFHAWRVRGGAVEAASLEGPADAVAALPAPPPSFTATGIVATPEGEAAYVALRLPEGGFTVAAAPRAPERLGRFRRDAARAGAALAAWLLLAGAAVARARLSSGR